MLEKLFNTTYKYFQIGFDLFVINKSKMAAKQSDGDLPQTSTLYFLFDHLSNQPTGHLN